MKTKTESKFPAQKKIWLFFEIDENNHSTTLRGVATDKVAKEAFEISLTHEIAARNKEDNHKIWWLVEENLSNHLYGGGMFEAYRLAMRNYKKYKVGNREIDGD